MSPNRSALAAKPYERPKAVASTPDGSHDDAIAPVLQDRPGFPTFAQYKVTESAYLESIHPRRRAKALISQALFDRVWDTFIRPSDCKESAQFRHWARKMFRLGHSSDSKLHVLLHNDTMVAVQEKIYPLLCHFHRLSGHAGRDQTAALIRKHYSHVPKGLVAGFVKSCPTCKATGRRPAPPSPTIPEVHHYSGTRSAPASPALAAHSDIDFDNNQLSPPTRSLPVYHVDSRLRSLSSDPSFRSRNLPTGLGLHTLPMSREVSLYQGLPNGWQFHSDYVTARAACIERKKLQVEAAQREGLQHSFKGRPRIPSIAPMVLPLTFQELMDRFPMTDEFEDNSADCIDPAFLSSPLSCRASFHGPLGPLYMHKNIDISESTNSLSPLEFPTPDLVQSLVYSTDLDYESPTVTELPTPQDESFSELTGSKGLQYGYPQDGDAQPTMNASRLTV